MLRYSIVIMFIAMVVGLFMVDVRWVEAQTDAAKQARTWFRRGNVEYQRENYQQALEHYLRALEYETRSSTLFNIGQCFRQLDQPAEAISYYQRYLDVAEQERPGNKARYHDDVQKHLAELQQVLAAKQKAKELETQHSAPTSVPLAIAPPTVTNTESMATQVRASSTEETSINKPFYRRWWFWTVIGATVVTGVTIGILASQSSETITGTLPGGPFQFD